MKLCFRIYTEDVNRAHIIALCKNSGLENFTVYAATGVYQSTQENALIIEVIDSHTIEGIVHHIARSIKYDNKQASVLVTHHAISAELV